MAGTRGVVATELVTARLTLTPLAIADAEDMVEVLSDPALYLHTGGSPPSLDELETRYRRQVEGRAPYGETWLNWVIRRSQASPIGFVQATVTEKAADLAWMISTDHQRQGYAVEASHAVATWVSGQGIPLLTAHVSPGHTGSESVAAAVGMEPSGEYDEAGEQIWQLSSQRLRS